MNDLDIIINKLIEEKGGSRKDYLNLLNKIAYHESAGTMDPSIKQIGGGPGRGKYQFEEGVHGGGITAAKRAKQYLESKQLKVPKWLENVSKNNSLDASILNSQQQDVLFLANMRMHPKADLGKVINGEEDITDFWANYHWAGNPKDRPERINSFKQSLEEYKPIQQNNRGLQEPFERPSVEKDNTNISVPKINKNLLNLKTFGGGVNTNIDYYEPNINEFNTGGSHSTNPHGGIPQGIGSNGKINTVQQGETSFKLPTGKFIFSNDIDLSGFITNKKNNNFELGGDIDPPKNKAVVDESKKFINDWFNNSVTKARYSMNMGKGFSQTLPELQKGLKNVNSATVEYNSPTSDKSENALYKGNHISFYKDPTPETATHEFTHAMGIDKNLTNYIKDNFGLPAKAIQEKTKKPFQKAIAQEFNIDDSTSLGKQKIDNVVDHSRYLSNNGELYPRIMEMRKVLNVKPGDIIDDNHIKKLKKSTDNPLFKYYTDQQIKEMLNTLASNKNTTDRKNLV